MIDQSMSSSHEELNISLDKKKPKAFVRAPRPNLYALYLVLKKYVLVKLFH